MIVRETLQKQTLDIVLPDGKWEIVLFELDGYKEILSLGRFERYG